MVTPITTRFYAATRHIPVLTALCLGGLSSLPAQSLAASTVSVFANSKGAIVQVRVLDVGSGAQQSIGSGFHVGNGHFVTNYHVIADLLNAKKPLKIVAQTFDKHEFPLALVTLDVVHDVAILQAKQSDLPIIPLANDTPEHGQRLYSIGNPMDLGFTIVEGTYNGQVKDDPRGNIHFTGALNPGVSGGPTITEGGIAVGINVASSGDEISYLVPIQHARKLLADLGPAPVAVPTPRALKQRVRDQLLSEQERLTDEILATPFHQITLGGYRVADANVSWMTCWGSSNRDKRKLLMQTSSRECGTGSTVYLNDTLETSFIGYTQSYLNGNALNRGQFLTQYGTAYKAESTQRQSGDDLNPPVCQNDFFRVGDTVFRGATCLQAYHEYPGLYDVQFKAAGQGKTNSGLIVTLTLNGFSIKNAKRVMTHYLDAIQETP